MINRNGASDAVVFKGLVIFILYICAMLGAMLGVGIMALHFWSML